MTLTDIPGLLSAASNASGALGHIREACEQGMPWAGSPACWSLGPNFGLLGSSLLFWGESQDRVFLHNSLDCSGTQLSAVFLNLSRDSQ